MFKIIYRYERLMIFRIFVILSIPYHFYNEEISHRIRSVCNPNMGQTYDSKIIKLLNHNEMRGNVMSI